MSPVPNTEKLARTSSKLSLSRASEQSSAIRNAFRQPQAESTTDAPRRVTRSQSAEDIRRRLMQEPVGPVEAPEEDASDSLPSASARQGQGSVEAGHQAAVEATLSSLKSRIAQAQADLRTVRTELATQSQAVATCRSDFKSNHGNLDARIDDAVRAINLSIDEIAVLRTLIDDLVQVKSYLKQQLALRDGEMNVITRRLDTLESFMQSNANVHTQTTGAAPVPRPSSSPIPPQRGVPPSPLPFPTPPSGAQVGTATEAALLLPDGVPVRGTPQQYAATKLSADPRVGNRPRSPILITTAESPDNAVEQVADLQAVPLIGPYAPGLHPLKTMVEQFTELIDYRRYRLLNTSATMTVNEVHRLGDIRRRVDARYPNLNKFSGSDEMALFPFLADFVDALNSFDATEGLAIHVVGHYLTSQAKDIYDSHVRPGRSTISDRLRGTWPFVVHALLDRFVDDDILRDELKIITDACQNDEETVDQYARRLEAATYRCRNVFSQRELVHNFILGLHVPVRSLVNTHLAHEDTSTLEFSTVKRLAERCSKAAAHILPAAPLVSTKSSRPSITLRKRTAVNTIGPIDHTHLPSPPSTPRTLSFASGQTGIDVDNAVEFVDTPVQVHPGTLVDDIPDASEPDLVRLVETLEPMFNIVGSDPQNVPAKAMEEVFKKFENKDPDVGKPTIAIPTLTDEQRKQAISAIPNDYYLLNCWTCRESGHSSFTCPYLTFEQRLFFALCFYRFQIETNPKLVQWYRAKYASKQGLGPPPGQKPKVAFDPSRPRILNRRRTPEPASAAMTVADHPHREKLPLSSPKPAETQAEN